MIHLGSYNTFLIATFTINFFGSVGGVGGFKFVIAPLSHALSMVEAAGISLGENFLKSLLGVHSWYRNPVF
jgi:uncharacterized membrane protein YfcA